METNSYGGQTPDLLAFVPEPGRQARVREEERRVVDRWGGVDQADHAERAPPLYGVHVGIKDIYRVAGLPTRAGSALPPACFEGEEASCVTRLKEAGAIVLGKTVTTEFAYREPGATRNPRLATHTPGGSSSGSAAAVAAGFCGVALGSQTVGSVIRPAAYCGVVGFKPSFDRIPTDGMLYLSPSLDHVGLFTVRLSEMLTAAAVLLDGWSARSLEDAWAGQPVLGVPVGRYLRQADADARDGFERSLIRLVDAGITIRRIVALDDITDIEQRHNALMAAEFAEVHAELFREWGSLYRPASVALYERGCEIEPSILERARRSRLELRSALGELMAKHGIDVFATPAATGAAPKGLGFTGDPAMNLPWTHAGMPTLTLPSEQVEVEGGCLPLGLQLSAGFGEDEKLLAIASRLAPAL